MEGEEEEGVIGSSIRPPASPAMIEEEFETGGVIVPEEEEDVRRTAEEQDISKSPLVSQGGIVPTPPRSPFETTEAIQGIQTPEQEEQQKRPSSEEEVEATLKEKEKPQKRKIGVVIDKSLIISSA